MGLLDKLRRVTASRLTAFLDQVEDPAAAVRQLMQEFDACLVDLRRAEEKSVSAMQAAQRRHDEAEGRRHRYVQGADLALRGGDEPTAREALAAQLAVERDLVAIDEELARTLRAAEGARSQQAALRRRMQELEARAAKLDMLKTCRAEEQLAAGRRERQQRLLNDVARMEVAADAAERVHPGADPDAMVGATLDERLRYLAREREVEKRLAWLRRVVAAAAKDATPEPAPAAPSASAAASRDAPPPGVTSSVAAAGEAVPGPAPECEVPTVDVRPVGDATPDAASAGDVATASVTPGAAVEHAMPISAGTPSEAESKSKESSE